MPTLGMRGVFISASLFFATAVALPAQSADDDYWLDETYSERALSWVKVQNAKALDALGGAMGLAELEEEAASVLTDASRLPNVRVVGERVLDYHQSRNAPLGVWRSASKESFFSGEPEWETLLDFDALSVREGRKWIFNSANCRGERCLLSFSDNGKDAHEIREFDLASGRFVADGFALAEGKTRSWWFDDNRLLVAPVLGPDSLNESGLPRTLRLWRRGTPLTAAKTLYTGDYDDAMLGARLVGTGGRSGFVAVRSRSFFDRDYYWVSETGDVTQLPLPGAVEIYTVFNGKLLMRPNEDWKTSDKEFPAGAMVSISLESLLDDHVISQAEMLYRPADREAVRGVLALDDNLYVTLLRDYRSAVVELAPGEGGWRTRTLELPDDGFISVLGSHDNRLHLRYESPLTPPRSLLFDPRDGKQTLLYQRQPAFDTTGLTAELLTTRSRDGTEIAYTLMRNPDQPSDGGQPTLVYGYGGFDVAITPRYEPIFGKLWLEKGGVYVHAYLRGGGENGPDWHRSAMLENRQRPYDDMAAVLEDLHRRGISSPEQTGIMGRSNGGLMVAAMMTQRPELMNAVVVGGPLTDMLHYQNLPPGASWTAEYGDPRRDADAAWIARYSPLQAISPEDAYPIPLIITSTDDDRVLPGHARRFAARLYANGHDAVYFEDAQGGHYWELAGGPAPGDWRARARARAVEFAYLSEQLGLALDSAGHEAQAYSNWPGIKTLHRAMRAGDLSAAVLVERQLARIDLLNADLNAVIAIDPTARAQAQALDQRAANGDWAGPLHGIPVLIKDNIETLSQPTTAGSLALASNASGRDAPLVAHLRQAGAVILGKANLSEWANFRSRRSASGWSAVGGQTRNPYDVSRSACGSSSGSGAAVAAGMAVLAVGTETNGSVVCPASANGLVGIKPSVGLISRSHIVPISHSQDTAGPMARSVHDAVVLLAAMVGVDANDPATAERPDWNAEQLIAHVDPAGLVGKRLGVIRSSAGFHSEVDALLNDAIAVMRSHGATVIDDLEWVTPDSFNDQSREVLLYEFKHGINAYLSALPDPELSGMTLADLIDFNEAHKDAEMPWFDQEIFEAAQARGPLTEPEYTNALATVQKATRENGIDKLLAAHDLDALILPTGSPAWSIDLINGDHFIGGNSSLAAISGYPNITLPMGQVHKMPVGLSIMGERFSEPLLIEIASGFEQASGGFRPPQLIVRKQ